MEAGGVWMDKRAVAWVRTVCKQFFFCFGFRSCATICLEFSGFGGGGKSAGGQKGGGTGADSL